MTVNPEFYCLADGITSEALAKTIGADRPSGQANTVIRDIRPFQQPAVGALSFQSDPKIAAQSTARGAVLIVNKACAEILDGANSCIIVDHPRLSFATALKGLITIVSEAEPKAGISPLATIASDAVIHPSATVMAGANIGRGTVIGPGAVISQGVQIGEGCHIGANAVLAFSIIGNAVDIGAGSIVGEAGFGFEMTPEGAVKMPHIGLVRIGDGVSIGSGCAIDRGSLGDTSIAANVMIDNLCHIAHNVVIGQNTIVAGQAGISGSVVIGRNVMMGGQVGIAPHVTVGDSAILTARSGVTKDVPAGEQLAGFPAVPARQFWRDQAAIRRLMKQNPAKSGK